MNGLVGLACGSAGLLLAHQHPLAAWVAPLLFGLAAGLFARWPTIWPMVLPALLPVIGLAPWTGWLTFEEWDLLVLAIATGGYLRRAWPSTAYLPPASTHGMSPVVVLVVILYFGAMLVSTGRGIADAGGLTIGMFQGYREPMNSVRLAKGLFGALLLYPLWSAAQRSDPVASTRHLGLGLALGLLAVALATMWERVAFTGLLNFSSDYRTTALFWEMHVGGAALDGMLALTFPFVVHALLVGASSASRSLLTGLIVLLAVYSGLTTFSRAVYLAVPVGLAVMLLVHVSTQSPMAALDWRRRSRQWIPTLLLVGGFSWAAAVMFPSSGYRGVLALLGAAALLIALPARLRDSPHSVKWLGGASGLALGALAWAMTVVWAKGAYLAYTAMAAITAVMLMPARKLSGRLAGAAARALALGGFMATMASVVLVAWHWGGEEALAASVPVIAAMGLLLVVALWSPVELWSTARRWHAGTAGAMLLAAGVVAVFSGGAYMTGRFSTTASDFDGRISHWKHALSMLHGTQDLLLGRGLGRYVDRYAFAMPANQVPGDYRVLQEGDNRYLRLVAGTHELGWGELMRISQRIEVPVGPSFVRLAVRSDQAATVHLEVCLKHLLYDGGCWVKQAKLPSRPGQWQTAEVRLDGKPLSSGPWYAPKLVTFSVASENPGRRVDIDNLVLTGSDGRDLLVNGDFSAEMSRWFMTSDRHHMPWHVKNMALSVIFDQGLLGLSLLAVLVAGALARVTLGPARAHPLAPGVAGGVAGFLVVGAFDSLLDVPRLSFLFYFLVLLGLSLRAPGPRPVSAKSA